MTLTKREKILIQIFICFLLFTLILVFLLTPAVLRQSELTARAGELAAERMEMENILDNPAIKDRLKEQQDKAEEYYDYFYSVLNSYTIDGIVNELLQKNGLTVKSLQINPYEDATFDFPLPGSDVEDIEDVESAGDAGSAQDIGEIPNVLVKSIVTVELSGNYYDILNLMDDLNGKSTCLRINLVSIEENVTDATGREGMDATLRVFIYGVNVKPEGAGFDPENAAGETAGQTEKGAEDAEGGI